MPQPPSASDSGAGFMLWRLCDCLRSERSLGVRKWIDGCRVFLASSAAPLDDFLQLDSLADKLDCQFLQLVGFIAEDAIRFNQGDPFFQSMRSVADATRLVVFRFFAAWTALNLGRLEQCVEECEKVDEPYAPVFTIHGQALLEFGRPKDAIEVLEVAIKLAPREPLAWFQLAKARHVSGEVSAAFEALRQCQRILPDSQEISLYMGIVALDSSSDSDTLVGEAMDTMQHHLSNFSENSVVIFTLLKLACKCRDRVRAVELIDTVNWRGMAVEESVVRSLPSVLRGLHEAGWMDLASRLLNGIAPAA